jgi:type IV secretory pathway VirB3-like protein
VISATFLGWSVLLMLILCFYRYLAICKPFYYRTRLSSKRTKIIMTLAFLWSSGHLSLPAFGLGRFRVHSKGWYCSIDLASEDSMDIFVVYLIIVEGILYTFVLGYLYMTVRRAVNSERRASMQLSPQQYRGANVVVIGRKRDEFARMTLLIALVYWTCSFPYLVSVKQMTRKASSQMTVDGASKFKDRYQHTKLAFCRKHHCSNIGFVFILIKADYPVKHDRFFNIFFLVSLL